MKEDLKRTEMQDGAIDYVLKRIEKTSVKSREEQNVNCLPSAQYGMIPYLDALKKLA